MTERTARFIRNIRFVMHGLSVEELYQVSLALRDEGARRALDVGPESKALTAAYLVEARTEHGLIFGLETEHDRAGIAAALRELSAPA